MAFDNIRAIEEMPVETAKALAGENVEKIKDHDVYFVDLGDPFGFSALVFFGDRHIHYANDYQLHHRHMNLDELRNFYVMALNNKLFTEKELVGSIQSYDEYKRKEYFLHNYYGMRKEYVSIFMVAPSDEEKQAYHEKIADMIYNPICFGYNKPEDKEFVDRCAELSLALEKAKEALENNYEYQKQAFLAEMYNHEYGINWQADYDTLSAFGNIHYSGEDNALTMYFDELGFTDLQRRAYLAARKEYFKNTEF